ncbi:hypothetical protein PGTUg99_036430 [Puccinia graminis f. sp. tritici]|uniref:Uncharacterized protein n=1 Tax=Puccinia graminis f. sp. tritici TaxID=56615 RepID=A0A5B0SH98_PUCGR|nr:hypothetical protein PGTUg99_036430 [Puccinia graminis f. sp. tritici]
MWLLGLRDMHTTRFKCYGVDRSALGLLSYKRNFPKQMHQDKLRVYRAVAMIWAQE